MQVQIKHITDTKGNVEAVQIPIEEWEKVQALIQKLRGEAGTVPAEVFFDKLKKEVEKRQKP